MRSRCGSAATTSTKHGPGGSQASGGATPNALGLAVALAQPWADVALSGATTVEQLRSKLAPLHLDYEEELDRRLATLAVEPAQYWSGRAALPWN